LFFNGHYKHGLLQEVCLDLGSEVKGKMGRIKCLKLECSVCHRVGLAQLFLNKNGDISYARTRHYNHRDKVSHKPQFTYCKIEDLEALKTSLSQQGISFSTVGQYGQGQKLNTHDPQLRSSRRNLQTGWAGSSARTEHHPPKVGVVGSNPTPPATGHA
jgi:hypothetical protein